MQKPYKYTLHEDIHNIRGYGDIRLLQQIISTISDFFLPLICGAILLVFFAALINKRRSSKTEQMSFEVYKKDWQMSHMYHEKIDKEEHSFFNSWLNFNFVLGRTLAAIGFTPNLTSVLAFMLSVASGFYFIQVGAMISSDLLLSDLFFALAVAFLLLSGLADVLDGAIARLTYSSTPFGDLLDNVMDKYSDVIVLTSIIYAGLCDTFIGLVALIGSLLVDYARARTLALGLTRTKVTIGERPFRMLLISSAVAFQFVAQLAKAWNILVPIGGGYLYEPFLGSLWWGILILAILTHFSTVQIALHARKSFQ